MKMPKILVRGTPYERGRQYGEGAAELIRQSLAFYRQVFQHRAHLDWPTAVSLAAGYRAEIAAFSPSILQELDGIADGAGVERGDILALNARSELMFAGARARQRAELVDQECTSFAVLPEVSSCGHTLVGQNWDWLPGVSGMLVCVEAQRADGPGYLTIVEAGLLAKVGVNSAGLGVCTNTLVSTLDDARPGVPYHVMLRALLDAETMTNAVRLLMTTRRAFSANYLLAHSDGVAVNAETLPGESAGVRLALPENGVLAHANHFTAPDFAQLDARVAAHPHSIFRLDGMRRMLHRGAASGIDVAAIMAAMRSHQNMPDSICGHPDPKVHPLEQRATLASVIADLTSGELWVSAGPPCATEYAYRQYGGADATAEKVAVT